MKFPLDEVLTEIWRQSLIENSDIVELVRCQS